MGVFLKDQINMKFVSSLSPCWLQPWLRPSKPRRTVSRKNTLDLAMDILCLEAATTTLATTLATIQASTQETTTAGTRATTHTSLLSTPAATLPSSGTTRRTKSTILTVIFIIWPKVINVTV